MTADRFSGENRSVNALCVDYIELCLVRRELNGLVRFVLKGGGDSQTERFRHRRWKGIADLSVCGGLSSADRPFRWETLNKRSHADCQPRSAPESWSRRLIS